MSQDTFDFTGMYCVIKVKTVNEEQSRVEQKEKEREIYEEKMNS